MSTPPTAPPPWTHHSPGLQAGGDTMVIENGTVIPGTPIAVDMWNIRKHPQARLFFLTHMHTDHTKRLTSSWNLPIYCSPISRKLLIHKFKIRKDLIRALTVGQSHIVAVDDQNSETMLVSVIDANHCPGAVMYLFQGYFGTILYTGDFRFREEMFEDTPLSNTNNIDVLYLDNTYCHPDYNFPPRSEALKRMIHIIETHPGHCVLIGVRNLGKEDMLADIAMYFCTFVVVTPSYYKSLQVLEMPNVFTDNPDAGYIIAMPFHHITKKLMTEWNRDKPTIGILPTALFSGEKAQSYANQDNIFLVPYSDHSSYQELHEFVWRVRPKSIIPIVDNGGGHGIQGFSSVMRSDMRCFTQYLDPTPREEVVIPSSVENYIYRSKNTNVPQARSKRRTLHSRTSVNTKRRAARGVVFDTTLSPPSSSAELNVGDREIINEKVEMKAQHEGTVSNTVYTKEDKNTSTEGNKIVEVTAKHINTIPRTKECRVSLNQITNHVTIVEDNLESDEVSFVRDVSNNKKRKLPQTLLSTLKRKPIISVLGCQSRQCEGETSALLLPTNSKAQDKALNKENTSECESETEKCGDQRIVIEIDSDSENEKDCDVDETNPNEKNCSTTSDIVEGTGNMNDVSVESGVTNCVDDSINTNNEESCATQSIEEESEAEENGSKWNNESGLSTGLPENQSDDDDNCPFCPSNSENEGDVLRSKNENDVDIFGSFAEHDVSEIDLIDDLLEEEASYLEVTL